MLSGLQMSVSAKFDGRKPRPQMRKLGGSRPPKFLSTHPSPEDRIKDLRSYAEKLMPLHKDAKRGGNPSAEE
jgi:predicted Zn-dependent protease